MCPGHRKVTSPRAPARQIVARSFYSPGQFRPLKNHAPLSSLVPRENYTPLLILTCFSSTKSTWLCHLTPQKKSYLSSVTQLVILHFIQILHFSVTEKALVPSSQLLVCSLDPNISVILRGLQTWLECSWYSEVLEANFPVWIMAMEANAPGLKNVSCFCGGLFAKLVKRIPPSSVCICICNVIPLPCHMVGAIERGRSDRCGFSEPGPLKLLKHLLSLFWNAALGPPGAEAWASLLEDEKPHGAEMSILPEQNSWLLAGANHQVWGHLRLPNPNRTVRWAWPHEWPRWDKQKNYLSSQSKLLTNIGEQMKQ